MDKSLLERITSLGLEGSVLALVLNTEMGNARQDVAARIAEFGTEAAAEAAVSVNGFTLSISWADGVREETDEEGTVTEVPELVTTFTMTETVQRKGKKVVQSGTTKRTNYRGRVKDSTTGVVYAGTGEMAVAYGANPVGKYATSADVVGYGAMNFLRAKGHGYEKIDL